MAARARADASPAAEQENENIFETTREQFTARLEELEIELLPLQEEHGKLKAFVTLMEQAENGELPKPAGPRRTRNSNRRQEFLDLVRERGTITTAEAQEAMGLRNPNYLYKLAAELGDSGEGVIDRDPQGAYRPIEGALTEAERAAQAAEEAKAEAEPA